MYIVTRDFHHLHHVISGRAHAQSVQCQSRQDSINIKFTSSAIIDINIKEGVYRMWVHLLLYVQDPL